LTDFRNAPRKALQAWSTRRQVLAKRQQAPAHARDVPQPPFARVPGVSTVPVALNPSLRMPVEPRLHV
jgi:hypothetical protein